MSDKRIEDLEKRLNTIEEKIKNNTPKKPPVSRKPSSYNLFMSEQLKSIKKENKDMPMKEIWDKAIKAWNEKKEIK